MEFEPELLKQSPKPVVDRYYDKYFALDVKERVSEDHCILRHTNRVCLVCVAPTHPLIEKKANNKIVNIEFQIGGLDRASNTVSGKHKRGQKLTPTSPLCFVHCENSNCIRGTLIEVNDNLLTNPELLVEEPIGRGYVAIILPRLNDDTCSHLLPEDEYYKMKTKQ